MDDFIAVFGMVLVVIFIFGIPFAYAAFARDRRHKEMMAMIEKGIVEPPHTSSNGKNTLRWGIVITALGLALSLGLYPLGFLIPVDFPANFGPWMTIGLIPLFFGLGLILIYEMTKDKEKEEAKEEKPKKSR